MQVSDERAELGTGALIIFIAIVLAAAIISVTMVATTESMFTKQNNDAATSSDAFSGIVTIVRLEVAVLAATDELHLTFEMPYIKTALPEDDISWTAFCPVETDGTDPDDRVPDRR